MRTFRLLAATAVVLVGCTSTTVDTAPTAQPTTTGPAARNEPIRTVYTYEPGDELSYDLAVTQDIEFEVEGDESGLTGGDDTLPSQGRVVSSSETVVDYLILPESPEDGAMIEIVADLSDADTEATVDGQPLTPDQYDGLTQALAAIQPIDFRVTVNDRNAVLSTGGRGGLDVLSGEVGALTSLSNNQLSRPLGPVFPEDREVRLGQEWRIESTQEGPQGPIVVTATHRLVDIVDMDGSEVLVIESITQTDGFELDFSEVFQSLFAGFASGESGEPVTDEALAEFADVRFAIGVEPSIGTATTLFDPEAGRVVSSDQNSTVRLRWILQTPDEETGEITGFELTLDITQTARFTLR